MATPNAVHTSPSGKTSGRFVTSLTSCSVLCLLLPFLTPGVSAYSSGAPESVCSSMVPGHWGSRLMYTNPFAITTSSSTYGPLQLIDVTIEPTMNVQIRGFLVQARPANNRNADIRIGSFEAGAGSRLVCNSGALTHSYSADRLSVTVTWRAPPVPQGDIVFRVTAVRMFNDYYTELYSDALSFQMPTTTTTPPPTTTTTTPPPTTTTTTPPPTTTTTTLPPTTTTTTPPPTTTTTTLPPTTTTTTPPPTTTTTTLPPTTTTTTPPPTTTTTTPPPTTTTTTPPPTTTTTTPPPTTTTTTTTRPTTTTTAPRTTTTPTTTTATPPKITTTPTVTTTTATTPANQPPTGGSTSQIITPTTTTNTIVNGTSPVLPPGLQVPDDGDDSTSDGVVLVPSCGTLLLLTLLYAMLHLLNVKGVTLT